MKVFVTLALALVAAATLSPASAMGAHGIAPRRQGAPLTAHEHVAHSVRRLEEVLTTTSDDATDATTEADATTEETAPVTRAEEAASETDADATDADATTTEETTTEAETAADSETTEAPTTDADDTEEVAPLIDPVSYKLNSTDGSANNDAASADATRESEDDEPAEENSAPEDEGRRNLRAL